MTDANSIRVDDMNDAEIELLLGLKADPMGCHDVEGVRPTVAMRIFAHLGIEWTAAWSRHFTAPENPRRWAKCRDVTDYEGMCHMDADDSVGMYL